MATPSRIALAVTLLVVAGIAGTASAGPVTPSAGFISVAGRFFSRLPESGVLLLWGTALAAASLAVSRKNEQSDK